MLIIYHKGEVPEQPCIRFIDNHKYIYVFMWIIYIFILYIHLHNSVNRLIQYYWKYSSRYLLYLLTNAMIFFLLQLNLVLNTK